MKNVNTTKIILHGGFAIKSPDGGTSFIKEVLDPYTNQKEINIALCLFALENNTWENVLEKEINFLSTVSTTKAKLNMILTTESCLLNEIENSEIVIIKGGDPSMLINKLSRIPVDLMKAAFKNKTIVGFSAGAYAISTYYLKVTPEGDIKVAEGLGFLPIKTIVHFQSDFYPKRFPDRFDWEDAKQLLLDYKPEMEMKLLREGEFCVVEY